VDEFVALDFSAYTILALDSTDRQTDRQRDCLTGDGIDVTVEAGRRGAACVRAADR